MKRLVYILASWMILVSLWVAVPLDAVAQCPMCKAAVESNTNYGEGESYLASMLNSGILYLFALPYMALMGIGFLWYRGYKRRQRMEAQDEMVTLDSVLKEEPGSDDGPNQ